MTDENAQVVQVSDYYPYGEHRIDAGTTNEQRKYIGEEYDEESELSYLNARYYNGAQGQFISQDPVFTAIGNEREIQQKTGLGLQQLLSDPQQLNSYSYGRNNPLRFSDPTGLFNIEKGKVEKGDTLSSITKLLNQTNGTNYSVSTIQKLNSITDPNKIYVGQTLIPNNTTPDITRDLTDKMHTNAADPKINNPFYFKSKVESGGEWDFKNQEGIYCSNQGCGGQQHTSYVFLGSEVPYDAPGNIHYGYVGSSASFGTKGILHYFAGQAQNADNNVSTGDTPSDIMFINTGIKLFNLGY